MATEDENDSIVIEGVQNDNRKFRPSDWVERIASNWASFGSDHRLRYSPEVFPCVINGEKCLVIAKDLHRTDPAAFEYVLKFAQHNQLKMREDRRAECCDGIPQDRRTGDWDYAFFQKNKQPA